MMQEAKMNILFFDGYCSLCNGLVDWAMRQDKRARVKFASLQGETARSIIPENNINDTNTVVYWNGSESFQRSDAILHLLIDMGGIWKLAGVILVIPRFFRDLVYKWIASNRYFLFGRRQTCRMPTSQEKDRLLP
tara:strand:+ start:9599 stop:10003 length:405 start_codon:yes stop_codon:yes gene_type:complete